MYVAKKRHLLGIIGLVVALIVVGASFVSPASASLRPGYYDLGGGKGVIVMRSVTADQFATDITYGVSTVGVLAQVVNWTLAGRIAWLIDYFIWMVPAFRIHWCATRYGAPYVYIYTIWNGLPVWADPAW